MWWCSCWWCSCWCWQWQYMDTYEHVSRHATTNRGETLPDKLISGHRPGRTWWRTGMHQLIAICFQPTVVLLEEASSVMVTTIWRLELKPFLDSLMRLNQFCQCLGIQRWCKKMVQPICQFYRVAYPFLMVIKLNLQSRPSVFDGDCDSLVLAFHLFGEHVHKTCESNVPKWGGASNIRWMHCWRPTLM